MLLSNKPGLLTGGLMHPSLVSKQLGQMSSRCRPIRAASLQMSENDGEEDPAANLEKILLHFKKGKPIYFNKIGHYQSTQILREVSPFFKNDL